MRRVGIGIIAIGLMMAAGCRHVSDSQIVAKFRAAGGGDPDQATPDDMGAWLAKHDGCQAGADANVRESSFASSV